MHEVTNKGVEDGYRFISYLDKNTGLEMTYFEQEIKNIGDVKLREFLQKNI